MEEYDSRLELAPRDVVARAIQDQMLRTASPHVYLDISHCQRDHVLTHFPTIAAQCLGQGIDITTDPIPVAPAAHFMCGGVKVRLNHHGSLDCPGAVSRLWGRGERCLATEGKEWGMSEPWVEMACMGTTLSTGLLTLAEGLQFCHSARSRG